MRSDPHPGSDSEALDLVVDAGSSWTKVALVAGGRLSRLGRFPTAGDPPAPGGGTAGGEVGQPGRAWQAWETGLRALLARHGFGLDDVANLGACSVVPEVSAGLRALAGRCAGRPPVRQVTPEAAPLPVAYDPVATLGADRVANAVAALAAWGPPAVVVDAGTAVTCDLVTPDGRFAGGAIVPGPQAGYRGLLAAAPGLTSAAEPAPGAEPAVTTGPVAGGGPLPVVGTSTRDCLRVGVLRGVAGAVDGIVAGYRRLVGRCPVVATGGLAPVLADWSDAITDVDRDLTLRGIALLAIGDQSPAPDQ